MQSFIDHVDPTLTESVLPDLGSRLSLSQGWRFKATTPDRNLTITTNELADIVPDNRSDMYQGCIDGMNHFDPWG